MPDTPMPHAYFFGYGSLVNATTHDFAGPQPAQLSGWRRVWRHTTLRDVAFLTVVRDLGSTIDGVIAPVPHDDWAALDYRERAYARVPVTETVRHGLAKSLQIAVYSVPDGTPGAPVSEGHVYLSYLDCVVQGYLTTYGESGVQRFFETTDGWDAPFVDDRHTPRYPRHCRLTADETALVDAMLNKTGARVTPG